MNLYQYTYDLVRQIPDGKISTYGAVARALGDIRASRAVGRMMNQNPDADTMPCFKIVHSDGKIGGFGLGIEDKIRRLKNDNIYVKNGKIIDFDSVFFDDFKTDYPLKSYRKKQLQLRSKLQLEDKLDESGITTIAGFDVAYPKNDFDKACAACVVIDYDTKEIIETKTVFEHTFFPYISTYLTFREAPLIQQVYQELTTDPSILMFDGNGILHPFHFGLASHAGVLLEKPSIGVAKSKLCGQQQEDNNIVYENECLGKALYANSQVKKPVYVSPGHLITLDTAYTITSRLSEYKDPKPVRQAHILATKTIKAT
jgi:deoxyribonuclease V